MFACESAMETDQGDYTMESTGIPLEYVEFELKHAKVKDKLTCLLNFTMFVGVHGQVKVQLARTYKQKNLFG